MKRLLLGSAFGWIALGCLVAQDVVEGKKFLTLSQCVDLALTHNLDVQIEAYSPMIARYRLEGSFSYYDPSFNASYRFDDSTSEGGFNQDLGIQNPNRTSERDSVGLGLGGTLPLGLQYDFSGNFNRNESEFFAPVLEYTGRVGVDLSQPLLKNFWIDPARANIKINRNLVKRAGLGYRLRIMNVVNQVERAYYDLIFARENVKVQEKAVELSEQLLSENRRRVELGAMAPLEEKQAESQVASNRANLLDAKRNLSVQENLLKSLITDDFRTLHQSQLIPVDNLTASLQNLDIQESWNKGMMHRPDLLQFKLDLNISEIQLKRDFNQLFPELNVIGGYGRAGNDGFTTRDALGNTIVNRGTFSGVVDDFDRETNPYHYYGLVLRVPLSNRQARSNYKATKAERERTQLEIKRFEQDILVAIDNAMKLAQSSFERVEATREARLYAEAALEAEQTKLENGKSTSFVVLQLQRDLTTARSQEIRAQSDYQKAVSDLSLQEGTILDKNNLEITIE